MSMKQVVFLKPLFTWPLGAAEQAGEIKIFWPASLQLHLVKTEQNKQKLNEQTTPYTQPPLTKLQKAHSDMLLFSL